MCETLTRGTNPEVDAAKIAKLRKDAGLDAKIVVRVQPPLHDLSLSLSLCVCVCVYYTPPRLSTTPPLLVLGVEPGGMETRTAPARTPARTRTRVGERFCFR